jgi:hypothetical protein
MGNPVRRMRSACLRARIGCFQPADWLSEVLLITFRELTGSPANSSEAQPTQPYDNQLEIR